MPHVLLRRESAGSTGGTPLRIYGMNPDGQLVATWRNGQALAYALIP